MDSAPLFGFAGRVALVTGASSGLGDNLARVLARGGARVVACARRTERLEALVGEIRAAGGEAAAVPLDVTHGASVEAAFARAAEVFGVPDIVVNNAGIARTAP